MTIRRQDHQSRVGAHVSTYEQYVRHLIELSDLPQDELFDQHALSVNAALNGGATAAVRKAFDLATLRASGAFFTGSALAEFAISPVKKSLGKSSMVLDPACGDGSLLVPLIPMLLDRLGESYQEITNRIVGNDISSDFARAAQIRAYLSAGAWMHAAGKQVTPSQFVFRNVTACDTMTMSESISAATHVVMNPPFNKVVSPDECSWSSGTVNNATVFVAHVLENMCSGSELIAILPESLRSGTRYSRWREYVDELAEVGDLRVWGRFSPSVDVDVFVLRAKRRDQRVSHPPASVLRRRQRDAVQSQTVADYFDVSVGSVVPHRHLETGPVRAFLRAKSLPAWTEVSRISTRRRFEGTVHSGPFVVARRTSSPYEQHRARATLITGRRPVAVENHLIILKPRDGSIAACRKLMTLLSRPSTTEILNADYRCRHLPVAALKNLVWSDATDG